MKKSIFCTVLVIAVIFSGAFVQAKDMKIAVVDMELVMNAYPETKSSRLILEQQLDEAEKEQQGMLGDRAELEKKFKAAGEKAQNAAFSKDVREKNRIVAESILADLRELERDIRETATRRRKELGDRQARMRRRIVLKLRDIVKEYCEKNDITLVLDSAVPGTGTAPESVVYSVDKMDITDKILALISKKDSKKK